MGIVYVRKKVSHGAEVGEKGKKDYNEEFTVRSDQPRESRSLILLSGLLPVYGSPSTDDPTLTCSRVTLKQNTSDPYLWDVSVQYGRNTPDKEDPKESQKPPDERRQKWSYAFTPLNKSFFKDLDGKYFHDTAHTPFSPPPDIPIFIDEWTVKMYEAIMDRDEDRAFMNATNTSTWLGCGPGEALVAEISRSEVFLLGQYWFESTYKILVNPKIVIPGSAEDVGGWDPYRVLNAGPRELDNSVPPKPIPIKTGDYYDGQPCPLDLIGRRIPLNPDGTFREDPHMLEFRVVRQKDFEHLPIYPPWKHPPANLPHSLAH